MTIEEIKKVLTEGGAQIQTKDESVWSTDDIVVASWAMAKAQVHVQGMYGVRGYSAFIFIEEPATEKSFTR